MKKFYFRVICACIFILFIFAFYIISKIGGGFNGIFIKSSVTDEWSNFQKAMLEKNTDITDMTISGLNVSLTINFSLNNLVSRSEVEKIFEETRNFILTEKVFESLQKRQLERTKNRFVEIYITFKDKDSKKTKYEFSCSASDSSNGNAEYNSFTKWYIEGTGIKAEEYKPTYAK